MHFASLFLFVVVALQVLLTAHCQCPQTQPRRAVRNYGQILPASGSKNGPGGGGGGQDSIDQRDQDQEFALQPGADQIGDSAVNAPLVAPNSGFVRDYEDEEESGGGNRGNRGNGRSRNGNGNRGNGNGRGRGKGKNKEKKYKNKGRQDEYEED